MTDANNAAKQNRDDERSLLLPKIGSIHHVPQSSNQRIASEPKVAVGDFRFPDRAPPVRRNVTYDSALRRRTGADRRASAMPTTFDYKEFEPLLYRRASYGGCVVDVGEMALCMRDACDATPTDDDSKEAEAGGAVGTVGSRRSMSLSSAGGRAEGEGVEGRPATYWNLVRYNRPYLLYILSYFAAHMGEWFTYVAVISAIQHIEPDSQTAVSALVVIRMIPNILFASLGGVLADSVDRRKSMIALDTVGIFVVLLYLPAVHFRSLAGLYTVAFVQNTVAALYDPVRQAIVPLLVPQEDYLKKATTISGLAWSLMAAVGASLGGWAASALGIRDCFKLDSFTYVLSAVLMWFVGGTWSVAKTDSDPTGSPSGGTNKVSLSALVETYKSMTVSGVQYLLSSSFAAMVLLKASGALSFGATDVLNASFSHREDDGGAGDSRRLGVLFGAAGVGSLVGPLITERFVDMRCPRTMQSACVASFALISVGYAGMAYLADSFLAICLFTMVRGCGSSIMWVNSSLLLQIFSAREMLGRVLSVDYGLCTMSIAFSAFVAGVLEDFLTFTPEEVSWSFSLVGFVVFVCWASYHALGLGAAGYERSSAYAVLDKEGNESPSPSMTGADYGST